MRVALAVLLGAVGSAALWRACREIFMQPMFARRNVRGIEVPVAAGLVLVVAAVAGEAILAITDTFVTPAPGERAGRVSVLVLALGFGLLGLVDDLAAQGDDRGFSGHLRAMARGRLTTGGLKLAGGGVLAFVVVASVSTEGLGWLVLDAALIALAANLANLFDRAPGRTIKVGVLAALPLLLAASTDERTLLVGVALVIGAAIGLLGFDLREQLMLGDTGSNVIGAALGMGVVLTTGRVTSIAVVIVLVALNLASERVSFSRVIDRVGPLRLLDRLGRRPPE